MFNGAGSHDPDVSAETWLRFRSSIDTPVAGAAYLSIVRIRDDTSPLSRPAPPIVEYLVGAWYGVLFVWAFWAWMEF